MFVQIDELPSMYSRPLLSRSNAPRPDKPLVSGNQFYRVPLRHERVVIWCGRRAAPTEHRDAAALTPFHRQSISRPKQRHRPKRVVADIFAREFLSTPTGPPVTAAHNRSTQDRPQSWLETSTRPRISWLGLHVWSHADPCASICVDSALR